MRTGVVSLAQNAAIPRLASTQIALVSSCDYLREQNETNSDLIDALASVKEFTGSPVFPVTRSCSASASPPDAKRRCAAIFAAVMGIPHEVQEVLIHDLRSHFEIGARGFAADQLIVLRLLLAQTPGLETIAADIERFR